MDDTIKTDQEAEITEKQKQIAELAVQVASLQALHTTFESESTEAQTKVEGIKAALTDLQLQHDTLTSNISALRLTEVDLKDKVQVLDNQLTSLNQQADEKNAEMSQKQTDFDLKISEAQNFLDSVKTREDALDKRESDIKIIEQSQADYRKLLEQAMSDVKRREDGLSAILQ